MALTQKEISRNFYKKRKENGLCTLCGAKLDRNGQYCSKCLEKINRTNRENKAFYREHHICTVCGKERVYGTDKICFECRAKKRNMEEKRELSDESKAKELERNREYQKKLYQDKKSKGICVRCGKREAAEGKTKCQFCLDRDAKTHRARYKKSEIPRNEWVKNGFCYICGGKGLYKNFKVCKKCHERLCKSQRKRLLTITEKQNELVGEES